MLQIILLLFAAETTHLVKERVHGTDPDGVIWGVGANCAVGDKDTLYVVDPTSFEIRIFNADLEPIGRFGRKGQGPGEFQELKSAGMTAEGNVGVFDAALKRLTLFSPNGNVLESKRLESSIVGVYNPVFLAGGEAAFIAPKSKHGKPVYDLSLYDSDMKTIKSLMSIETPTLDWSQMNQPQFWVKFLKDRLELLGRGLPVVTAVNPDTLAVIRTNSTTIRFYNREGEEKSSFTFDVKPKIFSPNNRDAAFREVWSRLCSDPFLAEKMPASIFRRAMERAKVPHSLAPVRAIAPLAGGLAVLTNYEDDKRRGQWLFFTHSGELKAAQDYTGPASFFTARGNLLIAVGFDADDDIVIQHLRYQGPPLAEAKPG